VGQIELAQVDAESGTDQAVQLYMEADTPPYFIDQDGQLYRDFPIEDLNMSKRTSNGLNNAGISTVSQLLDMTEEERAGVPKLGLKGVEEIQWRIEKLTLYPIPLTEENCTKFGVDAPCLRLVQMVVKKINVHAGNLYRGILPLVANAEDIEGADAFLEVSGYLLNELYAMPLLKHAMQETILSHLDTHPYGMERISFIEYFPLCIYDEVLMEQLLAEMVQQGDIKCLTDQLYEKVYPTVVDFVNSIEKWNERTVLSERLLAGGTLEAAGDQCGVTRERARQMEAKLLRSAPRLEEDRYALVFQKYRIERADFLMGFDDNEVTFQYLSIRYHKGDAAIEGLMGDADFPLAYRKAAERIAYKNYVTIGKERVLCKRSALSEYILRTVGKEGITFDEFLQFYHILLEDLNLQDNPKFSVSARGYANKLTASEHVLWKYPQKLRYYNIQAYDYTDLFAQLDLNQYHDVEYSALKFYREYPDVMDEYDIQDEYELHNLLKKICTKEEYPELSFNRMPNIEFGTADRDRQVMEMLLTLAPITNTEFAMAYEEEYGVLAQTVLANYLHSFDQYYYGGMYRIDAPMLSEIMIVRMKQLLCEDFYLLPEIREIYTQAFPYADPKLLNPYTIKSLGFIVYVNYAVKECYGSAKDYFRHIVTSEDSVDAHLFRKELLSNLAYLSEIYRLKADYEIMEYEPLKYVHIRHLNQLKVDKDDLLNYCEEVREWADDQYFTVYSLRRQGFKHELDELGYDEWFYASLLSEDNRDFSYRRMGKNKLFRRGADKVLCSEFIEGLLYASESYAIHVHTLVERLSNEYNLHFTWYKIVEIIRGSVMYFDAVSETIYADYSVYVAATEGASKGNEMSQGEQFMME
jgi:hypothetical protein